MIQTYGDGDFIVEDNCIAEAGSCLKMASYTLVISTCTTLAMTVIHTKSSLK